MDLIAEGIARAVVLVLALDPDVVRATLLTLEVSGAATLVAVIAGVAAGTAMASYRFPGRSALVVAVNASMGLPPVVVGLFVAVLAWRNGPLGALGLMYTPAAMVAAQAALAFPIVAGITMAAMQQMPAELRLQVAALGATRWQAAWIVVREAKLSLLAAVMAGLGGAMSEVGASMMVGGNIKGHTRILTTAIVTETSRGEFGTAIALGIVLLVLALGVTAVLTVAQQRGRTR